VAKRLQIPAAEFCYYAAAADRSRHRCHIAAFRGSVDTPESPWQEMVFAVSFKDIGTPSTKLYQELFTYVEVAYSKPKAAHFRYSMVTLLYATKNWS